MLWKLRPLRPKLPLMVTLWILADLIALLIFGLVMKHKTRKALGEKEILVPLPKNSRARAARPLLTRVK